MTFLQEDLIASVTQKSSSSAASSSKPLLPLAHRSKASPPRPTAAATAPSKRTGSKPTPKIELDLGIEEKSPDAFKTISEAAEILKLPQHVLRFWESKFPQIKPLKMAGNRRYYRPEDMETLAHIRKLLHEEGYTIDGARKALSGHHEPIPSPLSDQQKQSIRKLRDEMLAMRNLLEPFLA